MFERWERVETARKEFLDASSDLDLDREVRYFSVTRHVEESFPLWQTILANANHTTHHRADACTALTALGQPPESVDFIDYLRDRAHELRGNTGLRSHGAERVPP